MKGGKKFGGAGGYVSKPWGDRKPHSGGSSGARGGDGTRPDLHRATCNECGNSCEVPFKPNGSKPIYCSNCFRKEGNSGDSRPSFGDKPSYGAKPPYGEKSPYEKRSYGDKPAYGDKRSFGSSECKCKNVDEQFAALNAKIDALTKALSTKMF